MTAVKVAVVWFIMGLIFFYTAATFDSYDNIPSWVYYWWSKGLDVVKWAAIYLLVAKQFRWVLLPILIFSLIRFIWDIVSFFTGISVSNSTIVSFLFMVLTSIIFYLYLKELIKWQRLKW